MNDAFEPSDELTERLGALGRRPVEPSLQSRHLTAMSAVGSRASFASSLASRVKLGAAVFGGFLLGATGLATAGAMGPLQPIAKTTVEAVTPFELPDSASDKAKAKAAERATKGQTADKTGNDEAEDPKEPKNWDGCVAAYGTENRGQYLKNAKDDEADPDAFETARQSDCGKALPAVDEENDPAKTKTGDVPEADDEKEADKPEKADKADSARNADKPSQDGERGGKSGITESPQDPPVTPAPADGASQRGADAKGEADSGGARRDARKAGS